MWFDKICVCVYMFRGKKRLRKIHIKMLTVVAIINQLGEENVKNHLRYFIPLNRVH